MKKLFLILAVFSLQACSTVGGALTGAGKDLDKLEQKISNKGL